MTKTQPTGDHDFHDLTNWRQNYVKGTLDETQVDRDPFMMFKTWMKDAVESGIIEPNAMALATTGADGKPSVRMVLLKNFDSRGLMFFTNYESKKGRQLTENPKAALLFFWDKLERQIRIEGEIGKVPEKISEEYFNSRPLESRIAAAISPQSKPVAKQQLENAFLEMKDKYPDEKIPKPINWGGYQLIPVIFEFWQGRPGRLHDRIQYRIDKTKLSQEWIIERLAP